jgi:hypothetical protein
MALSRVWQEQVDELRRRAQIKRMSAELAATGRVADGSNCGEEL